MAFVPVSGPATFRPAEPPRASVVEFTDLAGTRTVPLPVRAALPVLGRARQREQGGEGPVHPSVALLSAASVLGLRIVADGRFAPAPDGDGWAAVGLDEADEDRVRMLAAAPAYEEVPDAEEAVRGLLAAVVDAVPRSAPRPVTPVVRRPAAATTAAPVLDPAARTAAHEAEAAERAEQFRARLRERIERARAVPTSRVDAAAERERAQLVGLSLRVEADEEELVGGSVRLVLQVHDVRDPLRLCDAARLWEDPDEAAAQGLPDHGFGERARTHAVLALRAASEAWPALDRFLELRVPDQIVLDGEEISSLLEDGVADLRDRGVDVLWPRSLGRDLTSRTVLDALPARPTPTAPRVPGVSEVQREGPLQTGMLAQDTVFAFRWQVALHGDPLTEDEMDQLAAAASPLVRLRDNWVVVDPAVARRARKRLLRTATPVQALAAGLTGTVEVGEAEEQVVVGASLERLTATVRGAATADPLPEPPGLTATLRLYQRQGLTWMATMTDLGLGAVLADDMGLGKTVTLIALHLHRRATGRGGPTLVVCPASLLGTWEGEVRRFAPGTPVRRHHGSARDLGGLDPAAPVLEGTDPGAGGDPGFVLTTYGTLRRDHEALAAVPWALVVADEAQHVKNPRSATARALRVTPPEGAARVALTGTPIENDLSELWSVLDWATPGLLGSRAAFRRRWAAPIESGEDPAVARRFAELVEPFLLRRRKSDPGIAPELPPKTETDHLLRLTREQAVLYETLVRTSLERIERADDAARRGLVLTLLTGLKQICNHPAHYLRQTDPRPAGRSEKLDLLDELLTTVLAEDGAVLVFTQYVAMARLLESHLARAGVSHQFLHGGTPVAERERMVERFQAGEVPVFLLSLRAGGTGLTLTRADHVVHVDRWWNPAVEDQATDRAYRIGQTRPVQVHRFVTQGTLEERIAELLARKRSLADAVLARGEAALTELSDAELRDLVQLRPEGR